MMVDFKYARYFGVHGRGPGHFCFDTEWNFVRDPWDVPRTPKREHRHFDGGWAPATRELIRSGGANPTYYPREIERAEPGQVAVGHHNGWTILSWWDSSGDPRSGSNSTILLPYDVPVGTELDVAQRAFPTVFDRFVRHYGFAPTIHTRLPDGDLQEYIR